MTTYLARAVPWRATTFLGLILGVLLAALSLRVTRLWPLEGCAVGLLAGAAAWCFDEPTAEIVDTTPRTLAWRTLARTSGVAWLLVWWAGALWLVRGALHGHAAAVGLHGAAAALGVTAIVAWRRSAGVPGPAAATAGVVTSSAVFLALARPYPRTIPLFPYVYGGPWHAAALCWAIAAALAFMVLLLALSDCRRRNRWISRTLTRLVLSGDSKRTRRVPTAC